MLREFHKVLAGKIDAYGLRDAHNARLRGELDACGTAGYFEGFINE